MIPFVDIHTHREIDRATTVSILCEGSHPWHAAQEYIPIKYSGQLDAIGEIGLDYACQVDHARQRLIFERELSLAAEHQLAVVIHSVRSFEDVMQLLKRHPTLCAVIFHGFIGSVEQARRALEAGYYLSFGARTVNSPRTIAALRATPLEQIFLESDDNPTTIEEIYAMASELRGESLEELKEQIYKNYIRLFR